MNVAIESEAVRISAISRTGKTAMWIGFLIFVGLGLYELSQVIAKPKTTLTDWVPLEALVTIASGCLSAATSWLRLSNDGLEYRLLLRRTALKYTEIVKVVQFEEMKALSLCLAVLITVELKSRPKCQFTVGSMEEAQKIRQIIETHLSEASKTEVH